MLLRREGWQRSFAATAMILGLLEAWGAQAESPLGDAGKEDPSPRGLMQ